jgi:DNA-binding NtrC family response regulator
VIAATNADLAMLVAEKKFREDLFYRLDVLTVGVAPLRERKPDVIPIAQAILQRLTPPLPLSRSARLALEEAEWPGNVRQLENILQRGYAIARSEDAIAIDAAHLFPQSKSASREAAPAPEIADYQEATRAFQARFIKDALEACGQNVSETARRIGVARSHLNDLIRVHGLGRPKKPRGP